MIRSNYDTLTLKLMESLDTYEKYTEKPKEQAFFTQLVSSYHSFLNLKYVTKSRRMIPKYDIPEHIYKTKLLICSCTVLLKDNSLTS